MPLVQNIPDVGYEVTARVLSDADLRRLALEAIVAGLESWRAKLARFKTLAAKFDGVVEEARTLLAREKELPKKGKNERGSRDARP